MPSFLERLLGRFSAGAKPSAVAPPLDPAELLGRKTVNLDTPELQRFLAGKRVLVTGAGGSIGSELCRQMMKFCPATIVLLDRAEHALFEIDRELRENWRGADLRPIVADICDARRISQIFQREQPQVIFHAAAHKHVPMMELNPGEAVKNNVFGSKTVADAALACGASAFVLISTDKAVNPTSVMGASKRVAELYVQSLNSCQLPVVSCQSQSAENGQWKGFGGHLEHARSRSSATDNPKLTTDNCSTRFLAVRFGNVLGSSGSVVPIFQKQIDRGGPVTVTDPEMCRYFMTIPEASQLVMQAGAIGNGGEIFVLDMGEPVRILDLAIMMIARRGLKLGEDIDIEFTGVRQGEKLFEELSLNNELTRPTSHERINVWELPRADTDELAWMLQTLGAAAETGNADEIVAALMRCVPEYSPARVPQGGHGFIDQADGLRLLAEFETRSSTPAAA